MIHVHPFMVSLMQPTSGVARSVLSRATATGPRVSAVKRRLFVLTAAQANSERPALAVDDDPRSTSGEETEDVHRSQPELVCDSSDDDEYPMYIMAMPEAGTQ